MRTLRILFMGTPDFAVATLKALVENKHTIVGVITAPDKPAGRGRKLRASAVKNYAQEQGLTILQPTNLKDPEFNNTLKELDPNLAIVVAFRMLPKIVWQLPTYGTFNLHASLLPDYRGAAPINWAIINGETLTGNTTFFIDEHIDTGAVIMQNEIAIAKTDTAGILHDKLMISGSKLVLETVDQIASNTITLKPQPIAELKTAYKLDKENTKINWNTTNETIYNLIRGLNPYPAAWCTLNNNDEKLAVKIYDVQMITEKPEHQPGFIILANNLLKVATTDGYIAIQKIQLPSKKAMDTKSLLNGYTFQENAMFS